MRDLADYGLVVLANEGYIGIGEHLGDPYEDWNKPPSQKDANRAHAWLRSPG
jgi:hypothetical protein